MAKVQDKIKEKRYYANFASSLDEVFAREDCQKIFSLLKIDNLKQAYILDAGCGSGLFGKEFASRGHKVIGVDLSPHLVEIANRERKENFKVIVGDLEDKGNFEPNTFDVIFFGGLLHHLPDMNKVINNAYYWLKKDGQVFILEPNGSNPVNILAKKLVNLFFKNDKHRLYLGTPNERIYSCNDFCKVLQENGFKISFFKPFILYYPSRLLKKIGSKAIKNLLIIRNFLYYLTALVLPAKYKSSQIIIVAIKK